MNSFFKDAVKGTATAAKDATQDAACVTLEIGKKFEDVLKSLYPPVQDLNQTITYRSRTR